MKRITLIALPFALLAACGGSGAGKASGSVTPQTEEQKTLYALGRAMGRSIAVFDLTPEELEFVKAGVADQAQNKPSDITVETYGPKIQELARARQGKKSEKEKAAGIAWAEKFAKEPGVTKLPSGVLFKSTQEGTGAAPGATDTVKVHYEGTLENGTVFDSSKKRGQPATFPLNGVIKCWTEGVQKMKVGGKATLLCPADTAYGDRGNPTIPGGATLKFDVELIGIEAPGAAGAMPPGHPSTSMPAGHPPAGGAKAAGK